MQGQGGGYGQGPGQGGAPGGAGNYGQQGAYGAPQGGNYGGAPQGYGGQQMGAYGQQMGAYGYGGFPPQQMGGYGYGMPQQMGAYGYGGGGYGGAPPSGGGGRLRGPSTNVQYGMPTGVNPMQGGAGGNTSLMPGDWICEVCQNNNFARRKECRRCGTSRSVQSTTIDERTQGTWVPPGGTAGLPPGGGAVPGEVYGLRPPPPGMGAPPPVPANYGQPQIAAAPPAAAPPAGAPPGGKGGAAYVPGDWICNQCQNHNFQWRTECKRCGAPRASDAQVIGKDSGLSAPGAALPQRIRHEDLLKVHPPGPPGGLPPAPARPEKAALLTPAKVKADADDEAPPGTEAPAPAPKRPAEDDAEEGDAPAKKTKT